VYCTVCKSAQSTEEKSQLLPKNAGLEGKGDIQGPRSISNLWSCRHTAISVPLTGISYDFAPGGGGLLAAHYCSRHGFPYIRGWMQMVLAPNDLFSWNNDTMRYDSMMGMLHYRCTMHNDTHSVHNRLLKPWWGRLPCTQTIFYVFSSPLSKLNWRSLSVVGGPGPPTPKVASPLLGSAHTPFPEHGTITKYFTK
jgi:hypothetical protein